MIDDNQTNKDMKSFIDNSDFTKLDNYDVEGFEPTDDGMSGCLRWDSDESDLTIYGTPNWEEDGIVPFQISNNHEGTFAVVGELNLKDFSGKIGTQKNLYIGYLKFIIENLDEISKNLSF